MSTEFLVLGAVLLFMCGLIAGNRICRKQENEEAIGALVIVIQNELEENPYVFLEIETDPRELINAETVRLHVRKKCLLYNETYKGGNPYEQQERRGAVVG